MRDNRASCNALGLRHFGSGFWQRLAALFTERAGRVSLLHNLFDGKHIGLGDPALAVQLASDGAMIPIKQTGEPRLPARAAFVVERIAEGAEVGGGSSGYSSIRSLVI